MRKAFTGIVDPKFKKRGNGSNGSFYFYQRYADAVVIGGCIVAGST